MRILRSWLFLSCLFFAVMGHAQAPAHAVPLDIYGRLPSLEDVIVSPDGKRIAYVKTQGDERALAVVALDPPALLGGVKIGSAKLRHAEWIDNDRILITLSGTWTPMFSSQRAYEQNHLLIYNINAHTLKEPSFNIPDTKTYDVVAGTNVRNVDGQAILYVHGWVLSNWNVEPALYKFAGDRHAIVVDTSHMNTHWLLDEAGRIAAQIAYDSETRHWEIRTRSGSGMAVAASGTADCSATIRMTTRDNQDGKFLVGRFLGLLPLI